MTRLIDIYEIAQKKAATFPWPLSKTVFAISL